MSWAEYTLASLDLTEESPIPSSRPYRQGRLSLDGEKIFVRFIRDETPWPGPIATYDTATTAAPVLATEEYTVPPTQEELAAGVASAIENARWKKVESGISWSDGTDVFFFPTDVDGRMNMDACQTGINANLRGNAGVWKCGKLVDGEIQLAYPQFTDAQITQIAAVMLGHVQKCFDAEAAAMAKLGAGDLTANFQTEFDAL